MIKRPPRPDDGSAVGSIMSSPPALCCDFAVGATVPGLRTPKYPTSHIEMTWQPTDGLRHSQAVRYSEQAALLSATGSTSAPRGKQMRVQPINWCSLAHIIDGRFLFYLFFFSSLPPPPPPPHPLSPTTDYCLVSSPPGHCQSDSIRRCSALFFFVENDGTKNPPEGERAARTYRGAMH